MGHKCLRCGSVYEDNDASILRGCKCGSVFFMYFRSMEDLERMEAIERRLKRKKTTLERELEKKIEERKAEEKEFGIETVKTPREGVYEINIDALLKKKPLIILERGRAYFIHLASVFEKVRRWE